MTRGDKRQQIIKAAERLFSSRRFHEITMSDVAEAAQVGKGTIYQYFADKNDLFFQIVTSGFEDLCDLLHRRVPEGAPFAEQLLDACREISRFFQGRRPLLRLMQSEGARMTWCKGTMRDRWMEKRKKLVGAVAAVIGKGVSEGAIRTDVPADALAAFLLGLLRTRAHQASEGAAEVPLEILTDLFCAGAQAGDVDRPNDGVEVPGHVPQPASPLKE